MNDLNSIELGKRVAAAKALELVKSGMNLGLGTGSTASWFVRLLANRIFKEGLMVSCVATSAGIRSLAHSLKIPLTTLDDKDYLDLTVDGADEFDANLNLIKGGGGALLQEKIVAAASKRMVVITDYTKESVCLGSFDLPVEIIKFGARSIKSSVEKVLKSIGYNNTSIRYRSDNKNKKFVTEEGHFILDLSLKKIEDAELLNNRLLNVPGVVETGLFLGMADDVVVGQLNGSCKLMGAFTNR